MGVAAAVFAWLLSPSLIADVGSIGFFLTYVAVAWSQMPTLTPSFLKENVEAADEPPIIILLITFAAVITSLVILFISLNTHNRAEPFRLVLGPLSVLLGWLTIHTMAAIHYAHEYYRPKPLGTSAAKTGNRMPSGGFAFPGTPEPSGFDFLYQSLTIGMTAQVSDVAITSRLMRRTVMVHATASFLFNTVIIAAAVNVVVTLAQ